MTCRNLHIHSLNSHSEHKILMLHIRTQVPIVVASSKSDEEEEEEKKKERKAECTSLPPPDLNMICTAIENKWKDELTWSIWDLGGQDTFHAMHSLFMTRQGVYLLVFDMHRLYQEMQEREKVKLEDGQFLQKCNEVFSLLIWLQSVSMYTGGAPVVLVGTHADKVRALCSDSKDEIPQSFYDIDTMLSETLPSRGVCRNLITNPDDDLMFYPVDNTLSDGKGEVDPNVKRLKVVIEDAAQRDPLAYLHMTLPMSWMLALDKLLSNPDPHIPYECDCKKHELSTESKSSEQWICVRCKTATRICVESGVPLRDVEQCMHTLHQRGALLFWRDNDTLRNIVVTNPKWLIEKISAVIRTRTQGGTLKRKWNRRFDRSRIRDSHVGGDARRKWTRSITKIEAMYDFGRRGTISNEGAIMSVRVDLERETRLLESLIYTWITQENDF